MAYHNETEFDPDLVKDTKEEKVSLATNDARSFNFPRSYNAIAYIYLHDALSTLAT
jgi:hypothetical protein